MRTLRTYSLNNSHVYHTAGLATVIMLYITALSLSVVAKSRPTLVTPWTVTCQAPLSMGFSRQEYWSGLPFPSPGDLPDSEIEPGSPALADTLLTELEGSPTLHR